MKFWFFLFATVFTIAAGILVQPRWAAESADRSVELAVDWGEVQILNTRSLSPINHVLKQLIASGVTTLLVPPQTLAETPMSPRVQQELVRRGVNPTPRRSAWEWEQVQSIEIGYDPRLIEAAQTTGLLYFLRINNDPWITTHPVEFFQMDPAVKSARGFLFSSEDPPGGMEAGPLWANALRDSGQRTLLFEFRPTRAARESARRLPAQTIRAHTISSAEIKDLKREHQLARWLRAVEERTCRFLLVRPGPGESWTEFNDRLTMLTAALRNRQWSLQRAHTWDRSTPTTGLLLNIRLLAAWLLAVCTPLLALSVGWRMLSQGSSRATAILTLLFVTVLGGAWVAILSWMPETRLQLTPFRGVKAAILVPWLLSGAILFPLRTFWKEIQQPVRRLDILVGVCLLGLVGYGLLRSGNASAAWKPQAEQGIRNQLEQSLRVRPRFKEFAVGIPLLVLGFLMVQPRGRRKPRIDPRWVIWGGMIGPVSIINTFCHLHSPLLLAFQRTGLGILLGTTIGVVLYLIYYRCEGAYETK